MFDILCYVCYVILYGQIWTNISRPSVKRKALNIITLCGCDREGLTAMKAVTSIHQGLAFSLLRKTIPSFSRAPVLSFHFYEWSRVVPVFCNEKYCCFYICQKAKAVSGFGGPHEVECQLKWLLWPSPGTIVYKCIIIVSILLLLYVTWFLDLSIILVLFGRLF